MGANRNKNTNWWKDKPQMEKILIILPIVIAALSALYVGLTYRYTKTWDEKIHNEESYRDQLNYKIEWENTHENPTIDRVSIATSDIPKNLPNQKFTVYATTGGIKAISVLYYEKGETLAITKLDLSDKINQSENEASSIGYACEVLSLQPRELISSDKKSWIANLFVVVEGYNDDRYIVPTVFEYAADNQGVPTGDCEIRQYNDLDLLFTYNEQEARIPLYDLKVLNDFKVLKERGL